MKPIYFPPLNTRGAASLRRVTALAFSGLAALSLLMLSACAQTNSSQATPMPAPAPPAPDPYGSIGPHLIHAADLPAPFASASSNNGPHLIGRPDGAELHVPPGFEIKAWSTDTRAPRWMAVAPNGDVFAAESFAGRIAVLRTPPGGGAPVVSHFLTGLNQPFGIAFYPNGPDPQYVYIADTDELMRYPYHNGDLQATGSAQMIAHLTPGGYNQHWTRAVAVSPDSKHIYVSVGSATNVDDQEQPPRACVMECNPDGSDMHVFASGLRNAVSMSFNPTSGALWAAVNERDGLGDNIPPDYVTSVKEGGFYGWPYCYTGPTHHDPRMPAKPELESKAIVPDVLLEAHAAALSIQFDTGSEFPKEFRGDGFAALHGSWNRSTRSGYKIVRIPMKKDGTPVNGGYEDFVWGWKITDEQVWGRPVCAVFAKDGSMLISDDGSSTIWRVTYVGKGK